MVNVAQFKKSRKQQFKERREALQSQNQTEYKKLTDDPTFWKLPLDDAKNGYAVIRFLPCVDGEEKDYVKLLSYNFRGKNGWYIENSPRTIGLPDPVYEWNNELWNSGDEKLKKQYKRQAKKFYANILVVKCEGNKETEGKVFKFEFGPQIEAKLMKKMFPKFDDETPADPFDPGEGLTFKLKSSGREIPNPSTGKMITVPNYEDSEFVQGEPLDDKTLEYVLENLHELSYINDPSQFKSYDDLKDRLEMVNGTAVNNTKSTKETFDTDDQDDSDDNDLLDQEVDDDLEDILKD